VVYQLRLKGSSLREIARQEGVVHQAVNNALMLPSSHLERAIAKELGLRVQDLFPERFGATGQRLNRTREPKRSSGPTQRNGKGARAA
jgi:Ner family transcriptional regulator